MVKTSGKYTVIEGNTRIAAYKLLAGLMKPPAEFASAVPNVAETLKSSLLSVDCTIAPSRDALLPIMASAHFGLGDKSKWGYLGSRKAVFDEWKIGKTILQLAGAFDRTQGQIRELILEYKLYLKALDLTWTKEEKNILLNPNLEFNPPVRFLQTSGHKEKIGVVFDNANLEVGLQGAEAASRFQHLIRKLVINPTRGLGATATYDQVFQDYTQKSSGGSAVGGAGAGSSGAGVGSSGSTTAGASTGTGGSSTSSSGPQKPKANALFAYQVSISSGLLDQLMREARDINCKKYPGAATFLLRNIVEAILKDIIDQQKANPASQMLDLEKGINLCMSKAVTMPADDRKVLKEFQKNYVSYLNLGAHGNVIPNSDMLFAARDCIDQFVKKNV